MNARLYDAALGRFLSPDPYVQAPDFSQSFNRYSYAWNNPLVYVDPDGEFVFTAAIIGMFVCAAIDYGVQVAINYASGHRGSDAWIGRVDFFDVGVSGVVGFFTVGSAASMKLAEAGVKTASGFALFLSKPAVNQFIKNCRDVACNVSTRESEKKSPC